MKAYYCLHKKNAKNAISIVLESCKEANASVHRSLAVKQYLSTLLYERKMVESEVSEQIHNNRMFSVLNYPMTSKGIDLLIEDEITVLGEEQAKIVLKQVFSTPNIKPKLSKLKRTLFNAAYF